MLQTKRGQAAALIAAAFALSACADSPMAPSSESAVRLPTTVARAENAGDACETITFNGPAHGTAVTNQFSVFGSALTFTSQVATVVAGAKVLSPGDLRIYAGGTHTGGPDFDLQSTAPTGLCGACTSNLLVINDPNDGTAALPSDAQWGGTITVTGFPANTYISSFQLADHEVGGVPPTGEPDAQLIVDGLNIAPVGQPQGVNTIITINTTVVRDITASGIQFIIGNAPTQQGSEAIDNIRVCQRQELGDEGCTPGYWKNHPESWQTYTPGQNLESVFNVPDALGLDATTLLQALDLGGGPGVQGGAQILLRAAVAALLNAAHTGVDYPQTAAAVIAAVNTALASNNRDTMLTLATTLDNQNNLGCPLN